MVYTVRRLFAVLNRDKVYNKAMSLWNDITVKIAKSVELQQLIKAKKLSDKNDYRGKNEILAKLLQDSPKQFKIDSLLNDKYLGLTHKPSGFKIHAPRTLVPIGIEKNMIKSAAVKERVRVVLPYKGKYLLERLTNPAWPKSYGCKRHVGGGIEEGETPEQAAAREMFEELGVNINPKDFKYLGKYEGQHYIELPEEAHQLTPGSYEASVGSDPVVSLEYTEPSGQDYIGPDLGLFKNK